MKRRLTLILALSLLASLFVAPAALAKETNHTDYWETELGATCFKDDTERGHAWTSTGAYDWVILKSSGDNDLRPDVGFGEEISTSSGKDISHMILCVSNDDPDGDPPADG